MVKPDWRRRSADVEDHFYPRLVHLLEDVVEPREFEMALGRLKGVPRKVAHADQCESRLLHQRNIVTDLFG